MDYTSPSSAEVKNLPTLHAS